MSDTNGGCNGELNEITDKLSENVHVYLSIKITTGLGIGRPVPDAEAVIGNQS